MTKILRSPLSELANQQGATALLAAIIAFLRRNNISKEIILDSIRQNYDLPKSNGKAVQYRKLMRAYEDMGLVMASWFSLPRFLDKDGHPISLTTGRGYRSVSSLVRSSRVTIPTSVATELMRQSKSVGIDSSGNLIALKRVFVLPEFEIPRAALVIERYLETLRKNSSTHESETMLLLERSCHVPEIDLKRIAPILRDIKGRGTAFMDSVDGEIEGHRVHRSRRGGVGEMGVLIFAWTRPSKGRRRKPTLQIQA